jgi:TPR repeat protein
VSGRKPHGTALADTYRRMHVVGKIIFGVLIIALARLTATAQKIGSVLAAIAVAAAITGAGGAYAEPQASLTEGLIRYAVRDYARARQILMPLAASGDPDAQLQLGRMYADGEGGPVDPSQAARWYERAAVFGKTEAQFALGMMYATGDGVPAHDAAALYWLRLAAHQGIPHAMNAVGELLMRSNSPQSRAEALDWFFRAAALNDAGALYHLGQFYATGSGVPADDVEAYKWMELAASAGLGVQRDAAMHALVALRERMMPLQVARATRSADIWFRTEIAASKQPSTQRVLP